MKENKWICLLAYVTGQNEYRAAENRIWRIRLPARWRLAAIGKQLGRQALAPVACMAEPDTILAG